MDNFSSVLFSAIEITLGDVIYSIMGDGYGAFNKAHYLAFEIVQE